MAKDYKNYRKKKRLLKNFNQEDYMSMNDRGYNSRKIRMKVKKQQKDACVTKI